MGYMRLKNRHFNTDNPNKKQSWYKQPELK